MATLAEAVQALPAELYDEIYRLMFTAPFDLIVNIDSMYKPPVELHVNSNSRKQFVKSYYGGNTIFYLPKDLVPKWSRSLTRHHAHVLKEVRVVGSSYQSNLGGQRTRFVVSKWLYQSYYRSGWFYHERGTYKQGLKFKVGFGPPDDHRWISCVEPGFNAWILRDESALSWYQEKKARGE